MSGVPVHRVATLALLATLIITRDDVPDEDYRALGARPQFASVAQIVPDSGGSASGVLIAKRWILTAAHVAAARPAGQFIVIIGDERIRVVRSVIHPDYLGKAGLDKSPYDQALFELEREATVTPAALARVAPAPGTQGTLVGYGIGGSRARDTSGTRRAATNRIDQLGGQMMRREWLPHVMFLDFDMPGRETQNVMGSAIPEPLEGIASGGDSGGGLFVQHDGEWVLAGTFSFSSVNIGGAATGNFAGTLNMYVGVFAHLEWITRTIGVE